MAVSNQSSELSQFSISEPIRIVSFVNMASDRNHSFKILNY